MVLNGIKTSYMKKLLLFVGLLFTTSTFAQVSSSEEFVAFSFLDFKTKYAYLSKQGWKYVDKNQNYSEEKVEDELIYSKNFNGMYYSISLTEGMNTVNGLKYSITTVNMYNKSTYESWVKKFKESGIKFKKVEDPNDKYLDKYIYFGTDFVITIETIDLDGYTDYIISIMI